jgi:predicted Rdx family selenoprotein
VDFVIHFCPAAEDDALALARRLFAHYDEAISTLSLIPVSEPEFDLILDGQLIHSYRASGRAPRVSDIAQKGTDGNAR